MRSRVTSAKKQPMTVVRELGCVSRRGGAQAEKSLRHLAIY